MTLAPASTALLSMNCPPTVGGTPTLFRNLSRQYPAGALRVITGLAADPDAAAIADAAFGHPVERRNFAPRGWLRPVQWVEAGLRQLPALGRARRAGVAEIHCGSTIPEGFAGWAAKRRWGLRFVLWVHGEDVATFRHDRVEGPLQRRMLRAADRIIANSAATAALCAAEGADPARVRVVLPGVDLAAFAPDPAGAARLRERWGLTGRPVLVTVARLQRRKGQDMTLRALPAIRAAIPDVAYLIVGGPAATAPQDETMLRALAQELGVADAVRFVGPAPQAELAASFAAGDVYIMPNRDLDGDREGFGQTFLEAAACGVPCIAGNSGGAVEAVLDGETGLVVDGTSPAAIAAAAVRLLGDQNLRARLATNARTRLADFTWEAGYRKLRAALA